MRVGPQIGLLSAVCLILALAGREAAADDKQLRAEHAAATQYYVDFRARPGVLLGHTIVVYGRLNARGQPATAHYAGLYPADGQTGVVVGSVVPVDASVRAVHGDFEHPATSIYRLKLTASRYYRLKRAIRHAEKYDTYWHILFSNCNAFAARMAEAIDLQTPPTLMLPDAFVMALRALNDS